jgi:hypothetical protein
MTRWSVCLPLLLAACDAGNDYAGRLEQADEAWVYRLDEEQVRQAKPGEELLHGFRILAVRPLGAAPDRQAVGVAVDEAVAAKVESAMCFKPRHAVRFKKGDAQVDLVICLECNRMKVYEGAEKGAPVPIDRDALGAVLARLEPQ